MKKRYIDIMERIMDAYTEADIKRYFFKVKENGITEHGFPRLTANIGILIAHGRRTCFTTLFTEMMDFCCEVFTKPKREDMGNDFSVKEIIFCIMELEKAGVVSGEKIDGWKRKLSEIDYRNCYDVYARSEEDCCANWALFTAVSEFMREYISVADTKAFVDIQIATQLKRLDENGMYRDNKLSDIPHPIVYDLVSRGLFCVLMHFGYNGKYKEEIDQCLKKAGLITLKMQSVNGEPPFGGRSNQFLHNEAQTALLLEYEANRYYQEGNLALAGEFKKGVEKALCSIEKWLSREKITHVKNNYSVECGIGCEWYAHFDKYMTTAASFLYVSYLFHNEDIPLGEETEPTVAFSLSEAFHKTFLKNQSWFVEIDDYADMHYDTNGIGRVHYKGAPAAICLSIPGTASPGYKSALDEMIDFSIAPGVDGDGKPLFAVGENAAYVLTDKTASDTTAAAVYECGFKNGKTVVFSCEVNSEYVVISAESDEEVYIMLPTFSFDGKDHTKIKHNQNALEICYDGYVCRYLSEGDIVETDQKGFNRNGEYYIFYAKGEKTVSVRIEIEAIADADKR